MTVNELISACGFEVLCLPSADREIGGVYAGDLLSWVMGRASTDDVWITIMSNSNVIAVATLCDTSCVIFAEGVRPESEIIELAMTKDINLICSNLPAYETAVLLHGALK